MEEEGARNGNLGANLTRVYQMSNLLLRLPGLGAARFERPQTALNGRLIYA